MEKLILRTVLICAMLIPSISLAQTYRACTEGGSCNTYDVTPGGGGSAPSRPGPQTPSRIISTVDIRLAQEQKCMAEKSRIEQENATCLYNVASDGLRETGRCNNYMNREITGGAGIQHRFILLNAEYTVQNPTYDKCINQVDAAVKMGEAYCGVMNARNIGAARSANKGYCAKHFP